MTARARLALLTTLALATLPAQAADFSFSPAVVSDYDFRGMSLSAREPALQLSFDVAADNGFYGYVWVTNTDIGVPGIDTEVDLAAGWSGGTDALTWDGGVAVYTYVNGSEFLYPEVWLGLTKGISDSVSLDGKLWYAWDYAGVEQSAIYLETNATISLPWGGLDLALHVGHSSGRYWDANYGGSYFDYAFGVARSLGRMDVAVTYVDGSDLPDTPGSDVNSTDPKVVLSLSTALPWR
jgi:uncharacterized protein (TIGR02001 family)